MQIRDLQKRIEEFEEARDWQHFPSSLIFSHLIEEIGEIGRHVLQQEGYKTPGLGHSLKDSPSFEFAQSLSLIIQLANRFQVNLEGAMTAELERMEKRFSVKEWRKYMKRYVANHGKAGPSTKQG